MAEQVQTSEIANAQLANKGIVSSIGNSLEKLIKFSNEPAVQRSIPVMITLFVIFIGMILFFITKKDLEQIKLEYQLEYILQVLVCLKMSKVITVNIFLEN